MATSVGTPVALIEPLVKFRCVPAIETPSPICPGFVPPVLSLGAVPSEKFRLNVGAKIIRLDLNAIVLTFAMLLPITSKLRALAANPDNPVNIATVEAMVFSLSQSLVRDRD